jgi:hypothetical protein
MSDEAVLLSHFESLGINCEFGLLQRRFGVEQIGLLRFSWTPIDALLRALRSEFSGIGENIRTVDYGTDEWIVEDLTYGFRYHPWINKADMAEDVLLRQQRVFLGRLRQVMLDRLRFGDRTFVYHGEEMLSEYEALALASAIQVHGPGRLLAVTVGEDVGAVRQLRDGLFMGYIDRLAPIFDAHDLSVDGWMRLCREYHRMTCSNRVLKNDFPDLATK